MKSLLVLCCIFSLILCSGCSQKPSSDKQAPVPVKGNIDPCSLLTKTDVEAILGEAVAEPMRGDMKEKNVYSCSYATAASGLPMMAHISVVQPCDSVRSLDLFDETWKVVQGIGDQALWKKGTLYVQKNNICLMYTGACSHRGAAWDDQSCFESYKAVCRKALDKL